MYECVCIYMYMTYMHTYIHTYTHTHTKGTFLTWEFPACKTAYLRAWMVFRPCECIACMYCMHVSTCFCAIDIEHGECAHVRIDACELSCVCVCVCVSVRHVCGQNVAGNMVVCRRVCDISKTWQLYVNVWRRIHACMHACMHAYLSTIPLAYVHTSCD